MVEMTRIQYKTRLCKSYPQSIVADERQNRGATVYKN